MFFPICNIFPFWILEVETNFPINSWTKTYQLLPLRFTASHFHFHNTFCTWIWRQFNFSYLRVNTVLFGKWFGFVISKKIFLRKKDINNYLCNIFKNWTNSLQTKVIKKRQFFLTIKHMYKSTSLWVKRITYKKNKYPDISFVYYSTISGKNILISKMIKILWKRYLFLKVVPFAYGNWAIINLGYLFFPFKVPVKRSTIRASVLKIIRYK